MSPRVPERNKKAGVCYAVTRDGLELPVVDITHPAFALSVSDAVLADLEAAFVRDEGRRARLPSFLQRLILHLVLRGSVLGRAVLAADGTYVTGLNTYFLKIGPDNLGDGYAKAIDRRIAAALPPMAVRLRLQDMVQLLVDGLAPALAARPAAPLRLVNIAGGPAADSLNTLIVLRKQHPEWIADRKIRIEVLDGDDEGPEFGARSLAALRALGAPLHGLEVDFERVPYNWRDVNPLRTRLGVPDGETIVAASEALGAGMPADGVVVGSVTRAEGPAQHVKSSIRVATRPRTLDAFTALCRRSGWAVARALEAPFSYNVSLRKA